jgi:hypothetical protein
MVTMTSSANVSVRAPEVAGRFYPDSHNACIDLLERCLAGARPSGGVDAKVLVAPHRSAPSPSTGRR